MSDLLVELVARALCIVKDEWGYEFIATEEDLEDLDAARELVIELLWNTGKPDSSPLWWCLADERKVEFRTTLRRDE